MPTSLPTDGSFSWLLMHHLAHTITRDAGWGLLSRSLQAYSILVNEWSCVGIKSVCGVSSLSSLMVVASRASWDTTELSDLQAVLAELFSCTVDTLPGTVARLWKWLFSAKDSNLSESLDDAYSSSGCSVLCPSSFLGEPSTITRKDFHGVFLSWTYKSNTKVTKCVWTDICKSSNSSYLLNTSFKTIVSLQFKFLLPQCLLLIAKYLSTTAVTVGKCLSWIVPSWTSRFGSLLHSHYECAHCRQNFRKKIPVVCLL